MKMFAVCHFLTRAREDDRGGSPSRLTDLATGKLANISGKSFDSPRCFGKIDCLSCVTNIDKQRQTPANISIQRLDVFSAILAGNARRCPGSAGNTPRRDTEGVNSRA